MSRETIKSYPVYFQVSIQDMNIYINLIIHLILNARSMVSEMKSVGFNCQNHFPQFCRQVLKHVSG
jgi:hypothetical protein